MKEETLDALKWVDENQFPAEYKVKFASVGIHHKHGRNIPVYVCVFVCV
jgi:hypothetical protein